MRPGWHGSDWVGWCGPSWKKHNWCLLYPLPSLPQTIGIYKTSCGVQWKCKKQIFQKMFTFTLQLKLRLNHQHNLFVCPSNLMPWRRVTATSMLLMQMRRSVISPNIVSIFEKLSHRVWIFRRRQTAPHLQRRRNPAWLVTVIWGTRFCRCFQYSEWKKKPFQLANVIVVFFFPPALWQTGTIFALWAQNVVFHSRLRGTTGEFMIFIHLLHTLQQLCQEERRKKGNNVERSSFEKWFGEFWWLYRNQLNISCVISQDSWNGPLDIFLQHGGNKWKETLLSCKIGKAKQISTRKCAFFVVVVLLKKRKKGFMRDIRVLQHEPT